MHSNVQSIWSDPTFGHCTRRFSVLAFEPLKQNVELLRLSLCLNPVLSDRVTLFTEPLSAEVRLFAPAPASSTCSQLVHCCIFLYDCRSRSGNA